MIIAERKVPDTGDKHNQFGEAMADGRLTQPSGGKSYRLREAILLSKRLGRPLTEDEMETFELV